jgi:anti-sigma factor RsiW
MKVERFTPEEARARLDAAIDGELGAEEQRLFEAALADDEELREQYEGQRALQKAAGQLGKELPAVDLLPSVQAKLRARSAGRFYRDRFAERHGRGGRAQASVAIVLALCALFVLLVLGWLAYDAGWLTAPQAPR